MITLGTKKKHLPTTRPQGALVLLWWVRSRNRRKRLLRRGVGATGGRLGACFKARTKTWGNPSSLHSFLTAGEEVCFFVGPPPKKKTDLHTRFTWGLVWLDVYGVFRMSVAVKCCHFVEFHAIKGCFDHTQKDRMTMKYRMLKLNKQLQENK